MDSLIKDIKYAFRSLRTHRGFSAAVILTLTLGIGINTSIFSFVNRLLFVQMPFDRSDELVSIYTTGDDFLNETPVSYPTYKDIRDRNEVFSSIAAYAPAPLLLQTDQTGVFLLGEVVTGNYFRTLGVQTHLGRPLEPEDDQPGARPVVVMNHTAWNTRYGGDPGIIGREIRLNGVPFTVVGVASREFRGAVRMIASQMWLPMVHHDRKFGPATSDDLTNRAATNFWVLGRRKPGITVEQVNANLAAIAEQLHREFPPADEKERRKGLKALNTNSVLFLPSVDGAVTAASGALMLIVSLVLLIACANIANLLMARSSTRRKEIAVRLSVGATRFQVIRQLLTENILLALIAGVFAIFITVATNQAVNNLISQIELPIPIPLEFGLTIDLRMLAFAFSLAVITGFVFGLVPALQSTRSDTMAALKDEASSSTSTKRHGRLRSALVVAQISLSLILLVSAGLFFRSLLNANSMNPGFQPERLLAVSFDLRFSGYPEDQARAFRRTLAERVGTMPTVESVAYASHLPLEFTINITGVLPEGHDEVQIDTAAVGPNYFPTAGIPILEGREFIETDRDKVIVNDAFVNRFWPKQNALGKHVRFAKDGPAFEVVGVVPTGRYRTLGEDARPYIYQNVLEAGRNDNLLLIRTSRPPEELIPVVRSELRALDPNLPLLDLGPVTRRLAVSLWVPKVAATLFGVFGALGLVIASVGILGVISSSVSARTREIGIRVALGASRQDVLRLVLRQGIILTLLGITLGLAMAALFGQFARTLLYGVQPLDPISFAGGALVLTLVAVVACYIPARRALRIDPVVALRGE